MSCFCRGRAGAGVDAESPSGAEEGEHEWHDAAEHHEWVEHDDVRRVDLHTAAAIDWEDEEQMLPPNARPLQERLAAIAALRKAVLAEPGTGVPLAYDSRRPLAHLLAAACAQFEDRSNAALERFLRARKYDLAVTKALFLEHRRWRSGWGWVQGPHDIATQLGQQKVLMQGLCASSCLLGLGLPLTPPLGHDGLPFVVVVARNHHPTGKEGLAELFRFFVYVMDTLSTAMGPGGQFRILVDLRRMSSANADLAAMKVAFEVLQKGCPERMRKCWLAEPPAIFLGLWRIISPFLPHSTREKFSFLPGREVKAVVGRLVPMAVLPADWGGDAPARALDAGLAVWEAGGREKQKF